MNIIKIMLILLLVASGGYLIGRNKVLNSNVKHGVMYKSTVNNRFYWEHPFVLVGIDNVEKEK